MNLLRTACFALLASALSAPAFAQGAPDVSALLSSKDAPTGAREGEEWLYS